MPRTCTVTRYPGAPARRAGRVWPEGRSRADLTDAEIAALHADPGYLVLCDEVADADAATGTDSSCAPAKDGPIPRVREAAAKPPAGNPAGRGRARRARKPQSFEPNT